MTANIQEAIEYIPESTPTKRDRSEYPVKLNRKHRKLIKYVAEGMSIKDASKLCNLNEYYCYQLLKKASVIKSFSELLEAQGITDLRLGNKISTLLEARKKVFTKFGIQEVDDNTTQFDTLKLTTQLKGHLVNKSQVEAPGIEEILRSIRKPDNGR